MSGFSIGNKTIIDGLYSLKAGELVIFESDNHEYFQYHKYYSDIRNESYDYFLEDLYSKTLNAFKKLVKSVGDRQVVVPLSAGNDSRLVVSVLKSLGVKNVLCYSYGTKNNFEAKIAKIVAEKLGFNWCFIPLSHKSETRFYNSDEYRSYLDYAETYSSVPYVQSLSSIKYLKSTGLLDDNAIFVNGNSGDFISGSHITGMFESGIDLHDKEDRKDNILNALIKKHFSLWGYLKTTENISVIKSKLWKELQRDFGDLAAQSDKKDHLFYEQSELVDRQSSYVITGQKAYEFYGYEWRLPLWDSELLSFFVSLPAEYKVKQKLYNDMLKKYNISGVWDETIPVNKKEVSPKWIIPVRFVCKIPFVFLGKDKWKHFDKSVFFYWTDVTQMIKSTSYIRMIKDISKKPRNHVSWQVEDYIEKINENFISK